MKTLTFTVPDELAVELDIHCNHHHVSRNHLFCKLLAGSLATTPRPTPHTPQSSDGTEHIEQKAAANF